MNQQLSSVDASGLPGRGVGLAIGLSLAAHAALLGGWFGATVPTPPSKPEVIELAAQARAPMQVQWLAVPPQRRVPAPDRQLLSRAAPVAAARAATEAAEAQRPSAVPSAVMSQVRAEPGAQAVPEAGAARSSVQQAAAQGATELPATTTVTAEPARPMGPQPLPGNALPGYPLAAREDGLEGRVLLRVQIDPVGTVSEVAIVQRSGVNLLDQTARDAVRSWRFRPASDGRDPVPSSLQLAIRFSLHDAAPRMELALAGVGR